MPGVRPAPRRSPAPQQETSRFYISLPVRGPGSRDKLMFKVLSVYFCLKHVKAVPLGHFSSLVLLELKERSSPVLARLRMFTPLCRVTHLLSSSVDIDLESVCFALTLKSHQSL